MPIQGQEVPSPRADAAELDAELRRLIRLSCELQAQQLHLGAELLDAARTVRGAGRSDSPSFWGMFTLGACAGFIPIAVALVAMNHLPCR